MMNSQFHKKYHFNLMNRGDILTQNFFHSFHLHQSISLSFLSLFLYLDFIKCFISNYQFLRAKCKISYVINYVLLCVSSDGNISDRMTTFIFSNFCKLETFWEKKIVKICVSLAQTFIISDLSYNFLKCLRF